jgi:hypothetical protein
MDPIRTALKYALIPLRTVVDIGDHIVAQGEQSMPPEPRKSTAAPRRPRKTTPRRSRQPAATRPKEPAATRPKEPAAARPKDLDDVAIARKVETIIFRDDDVPKGHIDVNCVNGVVWLRGEAKTPEMIKELERQTAAIPEVNGVENMLHLPKTPAPT